MRKTLMMAVAALSLMAVQVQADDIADGEQLYKTKTCVACHGIKGQRPIQTFPSLAGLNAKYLLTQMQDIKSGKRISAKDPDTGHPFTEGMQAIMHLLEDADLQKISVYLASLDAPKPKAVDPPPAAADVEAGAAKFKQLGCIACHGAEGKKASAPTYPALAGQNRDYLIRQMTDIRDGLRVNGQSKLMMPTIKKADDAAIALVATYLSTVDRSAK